MTITGSTGSSTFASAEIAFAYVADTSSAWFLISSLSEPVTEGPLATWDTTQVTDGTYVMRLRVIAVDGGLQDATVPFEIANYSSPAIATAIPSPTEPAALQIPSPIIVPTSPATELAAAPTPSALPPNPASLPTASVFGGLARGALLAVVAIFAFAIVLLRRRP